MFQFDALWIFLLVPLPLLGWQYLPPYIENRPALRMPFFKKLCERLNINPHAVGLAQSRWQLFIHILGWLLLVAALAKPVWIEPPLHETKPMRDILLAIDISQSMETRDYRNSASRLVDRLTAVKEVVASFIEKRANDQLGLIVFGDGAFVQAPLTQDHRSLQLLLGETEIGMAGPSTAIGDAIGLSIKLFENSPQKEKILILLTDGNDNQSKIPPNDAAALAAGKGIRIYTIGIGDPNAQDDQYVDLQVLQNIADLTEGESFMAGNSQALNKVYATLDAITPNQVEHLSFQPKHDLFYWPLGMALLLLILVYTSAAIKVAFNKATRRPDQGRRHGN